MSELRYDQLQRRWVIIATERQHRPQDFAKQHEIQRSKDSCPFCPGHEEQTPPELDAIRPDGSEPNGSGWRIRVTENKFPALRIFETEWEPGAEGFYELMPGYGAHEVVIEGEDHDQGMADHPVDLIFDALKMYRKRLSLHMQDNKLKYTLIFKNHRATAGASLAHPHSQIIGIPVTPRTIRIELMASLLHFSETGSCLVCDMIERERTDHDRMLYDDGIVTAFNSFASRFPFEMFITPVKHATFFDKESDETLYHLAKCMKDVLSRLKAVLNDPPFNFILHSGPNTEAKPIFPGFWKTLEDDYHWHIEVIPRLVKTAGFEWGSGLHINPMPPEEAAHFLRDIKL